MAANICSWITQQGGWESINTANIMELVKGYLDEKDLGFDVTSAHIMGAVTYYLDEPDSGYTHTGCRSTLSFTVKTDRQTREMAKITSELNPLGAITAVEKKTDFTDHIKKPYNLFFYFGHGFEGCLFDENGSCTIYADKNLKGKIIVLDACNAGMNYARHAVRNYGAIGSLGYARPLVAQIAGDNFTDGFKECFLSAQKELLESSQMDSNAVISAHTKTYNLYRSWADKYDDKGNSVTAHLFRANAHNLLYYTEGDVNTTVNISVTPTPAEVWHFGNYIGLAPVVSTVLSGGNVFRIKAKGCFLTWHIKNIPEEGADYSVHPMENSNKKVRSYSSYNMYLEHDKEVYDPPREGPPPVDLAFYNYGMNKVTITDISINKDWPVRPTNGDVYPHSMSGARFSIYTRDHEAKAEQYIDIIEVTVTIEGETSDTFTIPVIVGAEEETMETSELEQKIATTLRITEEEKDIRDIIIGTKLYTRRELIKEVEKGSEIGQMFLQVLLER